MKKAEYEMAKELGRQAARNGRKVEASPYKSSSALRELHLAWMEGFNEVKR